MEAHLPEEDNGRRRPAAAQPREGRRRRELSGGRQRCELDRRRQRELDGRQRRELEGWRWRKRRTSGASTDEAGGDALAGEASGGASAVGRRDGRRGFLVGVLEDHTVVEDQIAFQFSFRVFFARMSVQSWPATSSFF
jgi:hypothetical protein